MNIKQMTPASLQLLHIAAHLDARQSSPRERDADQDAAEPVRERAQRLDGKDPPDVCADYARPAAASGLLRGL